MKKIYFFILILLTQQAFSQNNILSTNPAAEKAMLGQFDPNTYKPSTVINQKANIIGGIDSGVSADSLKAYILKIGTFYNRNSGSDTLSSTRGIGAARRWVYNKFQSISSQRENRLLPSYLQFDQVICGANQHRNIIAVLPGADTTDKSVILIEGHIDSRCEGLCDTSCLARGIEDNATGSALVIELARVMSQFHFKNTLVFMVTIAEEQGLYGAAAFAIYAQNKKIKIKAVLNNDVIGGILCGKTASPPTTCTNAGEMDSTHVRIFSAGGYNSTHKALARFSKLQYIEELLPTAPIPMVINVMTPVDRTGRGGDHQPFSDRSFSAVRFTASHEHGDASNGTGYTDRQHTTRDTLGVDRNNDGAVDSFFVNFPYLQRNAVINGLTAAMASQGPKMPAFKLTNDSTAGIKLHVTSLPIYKQYKVSVRRNALNYDLDRIYTFADDTVFTIPNIKRDTTYYISLASMDSLGTESLFTIEQQAKSKGTTGLNRLNTPNDIQFNLPKPNPANNYTTFVISLGTSTIVHEAHIIITDVLGREINKMPIQITPGVNELDYNCSSLKAGHYQCILMINGERFATKALVINH